jgi:hypothetical protein
MNEKNLSAAGANLLASILPEVQALMEKGCRFGQAIENAIHPKYSNMSENLLKHDCVSDPFYNDSAVISYLNNIAAKLERKKNNWFIDLGPNNGVEVRKLILTKLTVVFLDKGFKSSDNSDVVNYQFDPNKRFLVCFNGKIISSEGWMPCPPRFADLEEISLEDALKGNL